MKPKSLPITQLSSDSSSDSSSDLCVSVDSAILYSPCTDTGCDCPSSSLLSCPLSLQSRDLEDCPVYHKEDKNCTIDAPCHDGLYCDMSYSPTKGICQGRKQLTCENTYECLAGMVCNSNRCINQYSIDVGEPATTRISCKSAIILDGICQEYELTNGAAPRSCGSNADCASKHDADKGYAEVNGTCVCLGNAGSYCKLHRSDSLIKEFLSASIDDRVGRFMWLTERINKYPLYEFSYSEQTNASPEFEYYWNVSSIRDAAECSSLWLVASGLVLVIIS